ncbi:MAG: hypothetical protein RLZZ172_773, partial [Bacteroidota bacterium]
MKKLFAVLLIGLANLAIRSDIQAQSGNALHFDGTDDYITFTRRISTDFTIEFWMKTTQVGGGTSGVNQWYSGRGLVDAELGGQQTDFGVTMVQNKLAFGIGNSDKTIWSTSDINTGNWVHVAVTRTASTGLMQIFINGVLESSATGPTAARTTTNIAIGRVQTGINYFNGTIDELRVWSTVRTSTEINANKDIELTGTPTGLVNYFKFNQGTAGGSNTSITTLTDAMGTADTKTLNGFAKTGSTSNFVTGATFSTSIATHPSTAQQDLCINGTSTDLSVTAAGASPYTYQWYSNASNSNSNGSAISGATSSSYTPSTNATGTRYYYVVVNGSVTSNVSGAVVVSPVSVSGTASGGQTICSGFQPSALTLTGYTGSIQWQVSSDNSTFSNISGATGATLSGASMGTLTATRYYRAEVTSGGCSAVTSNVVTVTVNALPTIAANSGSSGVCVGSTITLSNATAGGVWSSSNAAVATVSASGVVTGVAAGTANIVYTITDGVTGCVNSSTTAVTVTALPTITTTGVISGKCYSTAAQTTSLAYSATSGTMNNYSIDWDATANAAGLSDQGLTAVALSSTTTGTFGNGLDFDGVNDRVKFNRSVQDDFTIEFWMKTTQTGRSAGQWYFGYGLVDAEVSSVKNDFGVTLVGGKVAFGVGNPDRTIFSTSLVNTGNWVHVAATRKKSTGEMKLYINGVLEASYTHTNRVSLTSSTVFHLGYDINNYSYQGALDEVRIWNTVRTASEISANYTTQLSSNPSGLVTYFRFNQGTAAGSNTAITTATESVSGSGIALSNFARTGSTSNFVAGYIGTGSAVSSTSAGSGNITGINIPAGLTSGTYSGVMTTVNAATGCSATTNVTLTISGSVVSTSNASTTQSVCTGTSPTALNTTGVGTGLTYQWYSNSSSSNTGGTSLGSANGAQTDTYSPPSTAGTTYYYATVSNGSCVVTGSVFQVNVGSTFDLLGAGSALPIASAGYSFRKLGSCYSGPLGRFRIGSSYYDVYADGNNSLSLSSPVSTALGSVTEGVSAATGTLLSSLVGPTTVGYVGVWYDQSGNGKHLSQATTTMQPRIINNGVIETENGRPFIRWIGRASLNLAADMTVVGQVMVVNRFGSASNADGFVLGKTNAHFWHSFPTYGPNKLFASNTWTSSSIKNGSVWQNGVSVPVLDAVFNRTLMVNSIQPQVANSGTSWDNIGRDRVYHYTTVDGGYSELLVFPSALESATRALVESNEYSYYITSRPVISVQPQSTALTLCTGQAGTPLTVTASGTGLTYQWYSN